MPDRVVFNVVIPLTDEFTGTPHPTSKLREWFLRTARMGICRGGSEVGVAVLGLWFEEDSPSDGEPVRDLCNWYKFAVPPDKVEELRLHVERATQEFGQKCIYLERAGEADFIVNPALRPAG